MVESLDKIRPMVETLRGEGLKTAAELTLSTLSRFSMGERFLEHYAFGAEGRIEDPALHTTVAGIEFENPVMVGAGWDKKGRAVRGLYDLGFSGVEIGTVPLFGQPGNLKPRLWTLDKNHSIGFNRLGFNSGGVEVTSRYLANLGQVPCRVGLNIGLNKLMPHDRAPWAHAAVVPHVYNFADYFVVNPSSPNTPGLRDLQRRQPVIDILSAVQEELERQGGQKPLYVKISPDMEVEQVEDVVEAALTVEASGIIAVNTTNDERIKAMLDRRGEMGGISGNHKAYRAIAIRMVSDLYEMAGDKLEIIGVGAISTAEHAIERMIAGASLVQVVTGIRETNGRVAAEINRGLLDYVRKEGISSITELIGSASKRGPKYSKTEK